MSEIPEDVWKAAREAAATLDDDDDWPVVRVAAAAIMAERERCAKVADHWQREAQMVPDCTSAEAAGFIAADIRCGACL